MKINKLKLLYILYTYLPILIFLFTWLRFYISIPIIIATCYGIIFYLKNSKINSNLNFNLNKNFIIVFIITIVMCILLGQGGFVKQSDDWWKHNIIIKTLVKEKWPVIYTGKYGKSILSYYMGLYIIPTLIGKVLGGNVFLAEIFLLIWTTLGIVLTVYLIADYFKVNSLKNFLIILLVMFLFSTFINPMISIYRYLNMNDSYFNYEKMYHWISKSIRIQYSANLILIRFVFQQAILGWVSAIMILKEKNKPQNIMLILAPLSFYSVFVFLGAVFVYFLFIIYKFYTNNRKMNYLKKLFSIQNIIFLPTTLFFMIYFGSVFFQKKDNYNSLNFEIINYSGKYYLLILFEMSFMLWILILLYKEYKNIYIYIAAFILLILPFFRLGEWNDLVMRTSIIPLSFIWIFIIKNLINKKNSKKYKSLLVCCLIFLSLLNIEREIIEPISEKGFLRDNKRDPYTNIESYFDDEKLGGNLAKYQYFIWDKKSIMWKLLKKK